MRVVVDAQLPRRLVYALQRLGWDTIHTLDYPLGNETPDAVVGWLADVEERYVVTKDADFVYSNLLGKPPRRLILVTIGNIPNESLIGIFIDHALEIEELSQTTDRLTLSRQGIVIGLSH